MKSTLYAWFLSYLILHVLLDIIYIHICGGLIISHIKCPALDGEAKIPSTHETCHVMFRIAWLSD